VSRAALLPTDHRKFAAASSLSTPRADAERRTIPQRETTVIGVVGSVADTCCANRRRDSGSW